MALKFEMLYSNLNKKQKQQNKIKNSIVDSVPKKYTLPSIVYNFELLMNRKRNL